MVKFTSFVARSALLLAILPIGASMARGDEASDTQPYIQKLMQDNDIKPTPPEPEEAPQQAKPVEKKSPPVTSGEVQPYIQKLLKENEPSAVSAVEKSDEKKNEVQPYIETMSPDKELEPKYKTKVNQQAGFTVVTSNRFNLTSTLNQANSFNDVYSPDTKYAPSADLYYGYQLFRSPYAGAISAITHLGVITIKGKGIFTKVHQTAPTTIFHFYAVPLTIGGEYRFLQLHYLQPYVQLGAVGIPYLETRSDGFPSRRGISRGYNVTGGLALNLDWISRKDAWAQYENAQVLHTYLVGQLEFLRPIAGAISFNYTALYAGLMFEF